MTEFYALDQSTSIVSDTDRGIITPNINASAALDCHPPTVTDILSNILKYKIVIYKRKTGYYFGHAVGKNHVFAHVLGIDFCA